MSRVLRRPMFRGGIADSEGVGITSGLDNKYADGGRVGFKEGEGLFDFFSPEIVTEEEAATRSDLYPYQKRNAEELLNLIGVGRLYGIGSGALKSAGKYPQILDQYKRYQTTKPDFISGPKGTSPYQSPAFGTNAAIKEALTPYLSGAKEITMSGLKKLKDYGLSVAGAGGAGYAIYDSLKGDEKKPEPTVTPNKENEDIKKSVLNNNLKNTITEPVKSDEEVIKDYMEMFKANLATDRDELNSQRYLELAKFGLNLMSQPGGLPGGKRDLLGAIGRAGMPTIEGLSKIAAEERSGEKQAKILGFQAALKKLDNPLLEKYKIQSKLSGVPIEEVVQSDIQTAQAANVKQNLIKGYSEILDSSDPISNRRIAETIVNMKKDITQFQKHPDPLMITGKEKKGQYYYFGKPGPNGELIGKWDGKKFLLPDDEGFI
jgi:hypothetical protein